MCCPCPGLFGPSNPYRILYEDTTLSTLSLEHNMDSIAILTSDNNITLTQSKEILRVEEPGMLHVYQRVSLS